MPVSISKLIFNFVLSALAIAALAPTSASSSEEVNLYSARQPFLIEPVLNAFEAESGITVNMIYIKKGMLERIKAEGANTHADLILDSDIGGVHKFVKAGLVQGVSSPVLTSSIPESFRHPEGLWFGLTTRARVIFAHKDRVKPGELKTYEDLAAPHMKGRICTRSGKHKYTVALLASIIDASGEAAAEAWAKGVKANLARKPQGNDRAQVKAVFQGECDVALGNTYYMGKMATNEKNPEQKEWANAVSIIFPNQNDRGTHMNISGGAVTKSAKNKANAIKLLEFLVGDKAQKIYAEGNFEYPVKAGVAMHPLVASWGSFKADKALMSNVAEQRTLATRIMDRVRFDN